MPKRYLVVELEHEDMDEVLAEDIAEDMKNGYFSMLMDCLSEVYTSEGNPNDHLTTQIAKSKFADSVVTLCDAVMKGKRFVKLGDYEFKIEG